MYGLIERDFYYIRKALQAFPEIKHAKIFGSRALGHYKKGSDVDLTIYGEQVSHQVILRLNDTLNEVYPLPYMFDVIHYDTLVNENIKNHIDQFGEEIYRRNTTTLNCADAIL